MSQSVVEDAKQIVESEDVKQNANIEKIKQYLTLQGMFKNYDVDDDLTFTDVLELDLSTVQPSVAGPKRPHDFV